MPSKRGDIAGINMGYSQWATPHSDQVQFYINLHLSILLDSLLSCLSLSIFFGVGIAKNQQFLVKMAVARTWQTAWLATPKIYRWIQLIVSPTGLEACVQKGGAQRCRAHGKTHCDAAPLGARLSRCLQLDKYI